MAVNLAKIFSILISVLGV